MEYFSGNEEGFSITYDEGVLKKENKNKKIDNDNKNFNQ